MTTKDDRTNIFGIPYESPERDEAVAQYQRRSMHKLHIAEWHGAEFERLEREADPMTAKAALWHYRPDTAPLRMGKVLAPRVVR